MNNPLRVLIVDDSENDAVLLLHELERSGYQPVSERVDTAETMAAALERQPWDIVICDYRIPDFGGLEALKLLQQKDLDIPCIIVSGAIGEATAVAAMKAGANDYVMKDSLARLVPAIERELRDAEARREKQRTEKALRKNEALKSAILKSAPDSVIAMDERGKIIEFNPAAERMFGSSPERMAGKSLLDLVILPPVRGNYPNGLADYFAEGQESMLGKRTEISAFRSDGSEFPAEMAITRIELDGPPLFTGYVRDLSERRRAEAAQRLLAAIVESSEDAIIGQALDGTILSWNSGAAKIYGYPAEKMIGRSISLLVPKHRPAELPQIYEKIKRGEDIARLETVRVKKDGVMIDVSLTVSPIKDASGKVIGASSIERDITERKRVEAERLNLIQELTEALAKIKTLKGLLPICASCKKIRDDRGYWEKVELYISKHTEAEFTHGICPDCLQRLYPEYSFNPKNHADAQK